MDFSEPSTSRQHQPQYLIDPDIEDLQVHTGRTPTSSPQSPIKFNLLKSTRYPIHFISFFNPPLPAAFYLRIDTNVHEDKIPHHFAHELNAIVAKCLGKSESSVLVHLAPGETMSWGGTEHPTCHVYLMSVGKLSPEENIKHSHAIFEFVKRHLGISPKRMYITFDVKEPHEDLIDAIDVRRSHKCQKVFRSHKLLIVSTLVDQSNLPEDLRGMIQNVLSQRSPFDVPSDDERPFLANAKRNEIVRPFKCDSCSSTFTTKSNLRYHLRNVHNDASVICPQCKKKLANSSSLKSHLMYHVRNDTLHLTEKEKEEAKAKAKLEFKSIKRSLCFKDLNEALMNSFEEDVGKKLSADAAFSHFKEIWTGEKISNVYFGKRMKEVFPGMICFRTTRTINKKQYKLNMYKNLKIKPQL